MRCGAAGAPLSKRILRRKQTDPQQLPRAKRAAVQQDVAAVGAAAVCRTLEKRRRWKMKALTCIQAELDSGEWCAVCTGPGAKPPTAPPRRTV